MWYDFRCEFSKDWDNMTEKTEIEKIFEENRIIQFAFFYFQYTHQLSDSEMISCAVMDWELFWETVRRCWNDVIHFRVKP